MKKQLLLLVALFTVPAAFAQFGTATDFTVTDINGNDFNLFAALDSNKVVVVDVSATWCSPCWSVHTSHRLVDLYAEYGPAGTDQIRIIFYEGDASTTLADLQGTGGNTLGDWITGVPYPIINEAPLQLDLNLWAPQGFPTISVVRPSDRELTHDMYNYSLEQMQNAIDNELASIPPTGVAEEIAADFAVSVFPNPSSDFVKVSYKNVDNKVAQLVITNTVGQVVATHSASSTNMTIDISSLEKGVYLLQLQNGSEVLSTQRLVKN